MILTSFHYSVDDKVGTNEIRTELVQPFGGNIERNYSDTPIAIQFEESGVSFYVYRQISAGDGRQFDNQFIFIHIPKNEKIESTDLCALLEQAKLLIKEDIPIEEQPSFAENITHLGQQFEPKIQKLPVFLSDNGGKLAYRYYNGDYTLKELLDRIYQPVYQRYRTIILLDKKGNLQGSDQMDDLTDRELCGINTLDPAAIQLPEGIKLYYEGKEFREPVFYEKLPLSIELRKEGCISQTIQFRGEVPIEQWKMRVTPDVVRVVKDDGSNSCNFVFKINGKYVNNVVEIAEDELKDASISIEKQGYEPSPFIKEHVNMAKLIREGRSLEVFLKKSDEYFYIETKDYGEATLIIKSSKQIDNDPLEGYCRDYDNPYKLEYDSWSFLNQWLFWLLMVGALVLGGVGGCFAHKWLNERNSGGSKTPPIEVDTTKPTPEQNEPSEEVAEPKVNEAVNYLDTHDKWNKVEMENTPELEGFWDMLNGYDIDGIKSQEWADKLSDSQKYKSLLKTFGDKKTSDFEPKTYTTLNDNIITIARYMETVGNINTSSGGETKIAPKAEVIETDQVGGNNQTTDRGCGDDLDNQ